MTTMAKHWMKEGIQEGKIEASKKAIAINLFSRGNGC